MLLCGFSDAMLVLLHQPKSWINPVPCLLQEVMGTVRGALPLQWFSPFPFVVSCNQLFSCCFVLFSLVLSNLKVVLRLMPGLSWRTGSPPWELSEILCNYILAFVKCMPSKWKQTIEKLRLEGTSEGYLVQPLLTAMKMWWPGLPLDCMGLKKTYSRKRRRM